MTDLFIKPTDRNNVLTASSFHPRRTIDSLPYSQMVRVKRIVSDTEQSEIRLEELSERFVDIGYKIDCLSTAVEKVRKHITTVEN